MGRRTRWAAVLLALCAAVVAVALVVQHHGRGGAAASSAPEAVQLAARSAPSYLPHDPAVSGPAPASAESPAVLTQGQNALVTTAKARANARMEGPEVPVGVTPGSESTTGTFTVYLSGATAAIPLHGRDFTIQANTGQILTLVPAAPLPDTLEPGQQLRLVLRTQIPAGEGLFRWAPDGDHVAVVWDYVAELD